MSAVVNPRGQITLDRAARKRLGVRPGMLAVQQVVGDRLIITFVPSPHLRSAAGILGKPPRKPPTSWDDTRKAMEQAIADEASNP